MHQNGIVGAFPRLGLIAGQFEFKHKKSLLKVLHIALKNCGELTILVGAHKANLFFDMQLDHFGEMHAIESFSVLSNL